MWAHSQLYLQRAPCASVVCLNKHSIARDSSAFRGTGYALYLEDDHPASDRRCRVLSGKSTLLSDLSALVPEYNRDGYE